MLPRRESSYLESADVDGIVQINGSIGVPELRSERHCGNSITGACFEFCYLIVWLSATMAFENGAESGGAKSKYRYQCDRKKGSWEVDVLRWVGDERVWEIRLS